VNSLRMIVTGPAAVEASDELPKSFSLDPLHLDVGRHPLEVHARPGREPALLPESFIIGGTPVARDDLDHPSLQLILEIIEEGGEPDGDPFGSVGRDAEDLVDPPLSGFWIIAPRRAVRQRSTRTGLPIDEMDCPVSFDKEASRGSGTGGQGREQEERNGGAGRCFEHDDGDS